MKTDSNLSSRVTVHPDIRGGRPCIRGRRIAVYDIIDWLASGMSQEDILREYAELKKEVIEAALRI